MNKPLSILHLEDDPLDAELIEECLRRERFDFRIVRVLARDAFREALERAEYDLILSDFSLPDFNGAAALVIAKEKRPDTPFIFVSGTMGEDTAVECLIAGATDYVLKQGLRRLAPAVKRALKEAEARREREQLEKKFLQAQKMEVVGHLAGGIAHDFNNLLTVILGHVEMLISRNADPQLMDSLLNIHHAAESAGSLTRQLLTFSRKKSRSIEVLDLNRIIEGTGKMIARIIGADISLRVLLPAEPMLIQADSGMLEQVLMNLVVNAKDAMPGGGRLVIGAERTEVSQGRVNAGAGAGTGGKGGRFICLSVSDSGIGIPEENLARIFDPFFTTKEAGKGTGLGLATVYGIVQNHQGWVEVRSRPGQGTEFRVFFPEFAGQAPTAEPRPEKAAPEGGTETILVVEDEPKLRKLVRIMLEEEGYKVLEAASGREALSLWDQSAPDIALLLTDLILPDGMTGRELAENLGRLKPGLRVVYSSGYGIDEVSGGDALPRKTFFLQKPYDRPALIQTIRDCLEGGRKLSQSPRVEGEP